MKVNKEHLNYGSVGKSPCLITAKAQVIETRESTGSNGAQRLTSLFTNLLDKQFPITSTRQKMKCRFPGDFADALFVHVNHLNRSLNDVTGKTTSQLIAERIMNEACGLLRLTEWNICEIGWCLGFDEVPHFINFFKKNLETTPKAYRILAKSKSRNVLRVL